MIKATIVFLSSDVHIETKLGGILIVYHPG